jgi:hypothetical protein
MKVCNLCQKNYTDDELNFCLDCGGTLNLVSDDSPPTVLMNSPRQTKPNWEEPKTNQAPSLDKTAPFGNQGMGWTPPPAPLQGWQNQGLGTNTPFQPPLVGMGGDQTLPIIATLTGSLAVVLLCCIGPLNLPFGITALITGFLGLSNINKSPNKYSGKELAIIGLVTGGLATLVSVGWIVFWIILVIISAR